MKDAPCAVRFYIQNSCFLLILHLKVESAILLFRKLDGIFNYTEFIDDEDLSEGRSRRKTDAPTSLKGSFYTGFILGNCSFNLQDALFLSACCCS